MSSSARTSDVRPHHIKRLTLDLRVNSREAGRVLQQKADELCRTELPTLLDQVFAEFADERLCVDRIELNLPSYASEEVFAESFVEDLRDELRRQLLQHRPALLNQAGSVASSTAAQKDADASVPIDPGKLQEMVFHFLESGVLPWHADAVSRDELFAQFTQLVFHSPVARARLRRELGDATVAAERLIRQWSDVELARLLAAALALGIDDTQTEVVRNLFSFVRELVLELEPASTEPERIRVWRRIVSVLPELGIEDAVPGFVASVLKEPLAPGRRATKELMTIKAVQRLLTGPVSESLRRLAGVAEVLDRHAATINEWAAPQAEVQSETPVQESSAGNVDEVAEAIEHKHEINSGSDPEKRVAEMRKQEASASDVSESEVLESEVLESEVLESDQEDPSDGQGQHAELSRHVESSEAGTDTRPHEEPLTIPEKAKRAEIEQALREQDSPVPAPQERSKPKEERLSIPYYEEHPNAGDEYFISNAGLAVLAPFMRQYFLRLELLDDEKLFRDEIAQERAVHLLQFLVVWHEERPEFDLAFNKVLCGVPVAKPIDGDVTIEEHEEAQAAELIESAVQAWSTLKNTSVEGFRTSFLSRQGILRFEGAIWRLQVERTAIDVLLDTVPWPFSVIKQAWMDHPVMVEW